MQSSPLSRLGLAWIQVRDSLWFIPGVSVAVGSVLAVLAVEAPAPDLAGSAAQRWMFDGGAAGARGMLSAIAGGLITVTGTIFSVTIVALQLASSQFTPRLLRSFVADRVNQTVLGIFIGTFTYSLLVLRTIRSEGEDRTSFIPYVGVTLALVLLLVSIAALIVFINHAAQSIRASVILDRETARIVRLVESLFPSQVGAPVPEAEQAASLSGIPASAPASTPAIVHAAVSGYLQSVHAGGLWSLGDSVACRRGVVITVRMETRIGEFLFPGKPLAAVWPGDALDDEVVAAVRSSFVIGSERTPEQDVEYGLIELSDIAVKALSPGINDPTTAVHAIDRLIEVLALLASRRRPDPLRSSPDGRVRLLALDTDFSRAAAIAFDQIRHFGADNPAVMRYLLEELTELALVVPAELRPVVRSHVESFLRTARRAIADSADLAVLEQVAAHTLRATAHTSAERTTWSDGVDG